MKVDDTFFKNEEKCKLFNRKLLSCLNNYNGNFFYCNYFYDSYIKCMNFNNK